jgi:hypothetical protein
MAFAVDEIVLRSQAKWPDVPDVYGWLSLDRRGNWLLKNERIGNRALRDFISRNYQADARGRWYFQNGPQRVFVTLAYTPLVVRYEGDAMADHCGRPFLPGQAYRDEEGSVLVAGSGTVGLLDDRDLARFAERAQDPPLLARGAVPERFGYVANPAPYSLR